MNKYLIKIDRFFAWVLYLSMLAYFISGYGMTKGVIDPKLGISLHTDILPYFIVTAFLIHTGYAIHLAMKRWRIWNIYSEIILIAIYLSLFGVFVYAESYYLEKKESVAPNPATPVTTPATQTGKPTETSTSPSQENIFTLDELSKYNGENDMPAYVAVDGIVYDMSSVFISGTHYSHYAGKVLTDEFYSRHSKSEITKYPVVGKLVQ